MPLLMILLVFVIHGAIAHGLSTPATVTLNTGQKMPLINLGGTAQSQKAGDHYSNYSEFLRQGGRGLDTALTYTDPINRQVCCLPALLITPSPFLSVPLLLTTAQLYFCRSKQIRAAINAHPEIPREEIWVTTKVPCCPNPGLDFCRDREYNRSIAEDMMRNNALLGLKTTDITLLHHPCAEDEDTILRWMDLEAALERGLTKAIGVSNFNAALLAKIAADKRTKITPAVNQCNHAIGNHNESHSPGSGGDDATVAYCKAHGISYSAYSPLEGLSNEDIWKLPTVQNIAKAHNVSGPQIALKWLVQQNISVVTAAHNPAYIAEDIDLWSWGELTAAEMQTLAAI